MTLLLAALLAAAPGSGQDPPLPRSEKLALSSAKPDRARVGRYEAVELALDLQAAYDNPFDPEQIDVWAIFRAPDGRELRADGFLYRSYTHALEGRQEKLTPAGPPAWKVRFTPDRSGVWCYRFHARDRSGEVSLREARITVTESERPGFIRRSKRNPAVFAYEDERPVFLVGENMCWGGWNGVRGTFDYEEWLPALGKAGGNWIRVWMSSWNCALEWTPDTNSPGSEYRGVGIYSLGNAWKLDRILDLAEKQGISVMLCFGTYGEFTEGGFFNEGQWKANPYNRANGGPCEKPEEFWTNPEARKLYRRRLRYLIARYAARTSIHSWEFWNEALAPPEWVAEMARYVKSIDPYKHLLTTSYGNDAVWKIPEIDLTQTHHYGKGDVADSGPVIYEDARKHAVYPKPHLMAEFGIDWRKGDEHYDPDGRGVNLHNGLWSAMLGGNAGGAMIWWWDGYVHPRNVYGRFTSLREFADQVPWTRGPWTPRDVRGAAPESCVYALASGPEAILWAQNAAHNWQNLYEKRPIPPAPPSEALIEGLPPGRYRIRWWDTWAGRAVREEQAAADARGLTIRLPELATDIAARISPIASGPRGRR